MVYPQILSKTFLALILTTIVLTMCPHIPHETLKQFDMD